MDFLDMLKILKRSVNPRKKKELVHFMTHSFVIIYQVINLCLVFYWFIGAVNNRINRQKTIANVCCCAIRQQHAS